MSPRRLLPFLAVFLVVAAAYIFLEWHQGRQARQQEEARKVFRVEEGDITTITLQRPQEEIQLVREDKDWRLVQPIKEQADRVALNSLASTLARVRRTRDLGAEKDLKPFGLEEPGLKVSFTARDKSHTLSVGQKIPGGEGYYARRDQDPGVLVIPDSSKESLDRRLSDLRNRSLFNFTVEQVKGLRVKTPRIQVTLEKKGEEWQWAGKKNFDVFPERLERLLRFVSLARVKEFVTDEPQDLRQYGLASPGVEITVVTDKGEQRLWLGAREKNQVFARRGEVGPVVLMEDLILDLFVTPLQSVAALQKMPLWSQVRGSFPQYLEDRRIWSGEVKDVTRFTWGPPGKTWTGVRDQDFFKLTGPDGQEVRQPAVRVELALLKLRDLESAGQATAGEASQAKIQNSLELWDQKGQIIFRLEELGETHGKVKVRYGSGDQATREALVNKKAYEQWQKDMAQLTTPRPSQEGRKQQ
ncbi:MAG: DUF4340 domain-containing protein [Thermodesulfobacteriota bacterium]